MSSKEKKIAKFFGGKLQNVSLEVYESNPNYFLDLAETTCDWLKEDIFKIRQTNYQSMAISKIIEAIAKSHITGNKISIDAVMLLPKNPVHKEGTKKELEKSLIETLESFDKRVRDFLSHQKNSDIAKLAKQISEEEFLETCSANIYFNFTSAIQKNRFSDPDTDGNAKADISSRKKSFSGVVKLVPDAQRYHLNKSMSDEKLEKWKETVRRYLKKMNTETVDVLHIIFDKVIKEARNHESMVTISVDDFRRMKGVKKAIDGSKRRGGNQKNLRDRFIYHISILSSFYIDVFKMTVIKNDPKTDKKKKVPNFSIKGPAIVVDMIKEVDSKPHTFQVRPGGVFSPFLFGPGRQIGLLHSEALKFHPVNQVPEKLLTHYFAWQWRIRQNKGTYLESYFVKTLIEESCIKIDKNYLSRARERLEKALNTLLNKKIIVGWEYDNHFDESIVGKIGWFEIFLKAKIAIEPADAVMDHHAENIRSYKICKEPTANHTEISQKLKETRKKLGLTQMQSAEEIGIERSYISKIERGTYIPGPKIGVAINKWLKNRQIT